MHPSPDRSPREDVLTARAASAWLAERGTTGDGPSHLIADEVAVPGFRVARVWHTASTLVRAATPGVRFAVVVADGDADATQGGATRRLGSGDLLVAADSGPLTLRIDDRIARFEFEVRTAGTGVSPAVTEVLDAGAVVADAAPSFRPVLLAAVNAAFNAGLDSDAAGFASFRLATTSLLTGLLEEAFADRLGARSAGAARLHRRALDAIALQAADPDFSTAALARALAVSDRHLRRIFEQEGSTPTGALREARLARARALLSTDAPLPSHEVARLAGFRSSRALRRADLRRSATG